jgi:hypothetical protein
MDVCGIIPTLRDRPIRDLDGLLLGRLEDVLFDATSNRPAWFVVRLSGEDERRTLVPAGRSRPSLDGYCVAADAATVRACPVALPAPLPLREHVAAASRHYGLPRFTRAEAFTSATPAAAVAGAGAPARAA